MSNIVSVLASLCGKSRMLAECRMMLRYPSVHAIRRSAQPRGLPNHFEPAAALAVAAAATISDTWHRGYAAAVFVAPAEEHMQHLASMLAQHRCPGDCYCLYGPVGSGKSVFSRAFIRSAAADPQLPVPSPTYLLQMIYDDHEGPPIHHFDLYRLDRQSDMSRLDLAQSFNGAVSLVEWAERLSEQQLPQQRLEVHIDIMQQAAGLPAAGASIDNHAQEQQQQQVTYLSIFGQEQQQQQGVLPLVHTQQQQQEQQQQQQHLAGCAVTILLPIPQLSQMQQPASGSGIATVHGSIVVADTAPIAGAGLIPPCDGFSEMDEEAEDLFTDQRWRKVTLKAFGADWVGRLQHLAKQMCSTTVL